MDEFVDVAVVRGEELDLKLEFLDGRLHRLDLFPTLHDLLLHKGRTLQQCVCLLLLLCLQLIQQPQTWQVYLSLGLLLWVTEGDLLGVFANVGLLNLRPVSVLARLNRREI